MRNWFGKAGNGRHVSCVIRKDNSDLHETEQPSDETNFIQKMNI